MSWAKSLAWTKAVSVEGCCNPNRPTYADPAYCLTYPLRGYCLNVLKTQLFGNRLSKGEFFRIRYSRRFLVLTGVVSSSPRTCFKYHFLEYLELLKFSLLMLNYGTANLFWYNLMQKKNSHGSWNK